MAVGYLFQAHLRSTYSRIISIFALITVLFGCFCNVWTFRLYRSLANGIEKAARDLKIDYDEENHRIFKIVMFCVAIELLLQMLAFVYFIVSPP